MLRRLIWTGEYTEAVSDASKDANATLHALLMLAERNRETVASQTEAQRDILTLLWEIRTAPLPDVHRNEMAQSQGRQNRD
jgi:hypothetical protein